jgi:hypothetical protein
MAVRLNESIRFVTTAEDKRLLETLSAQDGDYNMSVTLRRLIRSEAQRRGIDAPVVMDEPQQAAA